ncbi:N-acetylmuramoyl-L-alanine amidase [Lentibacillus sp. JNUCC-1]|nr:N-acetylmuramoyl-L-alanine amidase [Lentibacillus sp. JNUCC-1]
MRKKLGWLSVTTIIGIMLICSIHLFADTAVVEYDHLNVRSGPGTDYEKIGQVNTTDTFPIEKEDGEWVQIQYNGQSGWVSSEYITVKQDTAEHEPDSNSNQPEKSKSENEPLKTLTIQNEKVHLRKGPSIEYDITAFADKGETFDVVSETEGWLEIVSDEKNGFVYKALLAKDDQSGYGILKNKTIVIDAGHGGRDVGAIGAGGSYEKDFTLKTTLALAKELRYMGANVIMTRSQDRFKSLANRSALANNANTDAFISIHYNSTPEYPSASGIVSYYYHDQDQSLAEYIHQGLVEKTEARDRGVLKENYFVIRQTFKPAVLLELGFISNPESEGLLTTEQYQQKLVKGITLGIQKYFRNAQ